MDFADREERTLQSKKTTQYFSRFSPYLSPTKLLFVRDQASAISVCQTSIFQSENDIRNALTCFLVKGLYDGQVVTCQNPNVGI